jgi:hypothetical protein
MCIGTANSVTVVGKTGADPRVREQLYAHWPHSQFTGITSLKSFRPPPGATCTCFKLSVSRLIVTGHIADLNLFRHSSATTNEL